MTPKEMLKQKVWAVIGVTQDEEKYGYKIYKRLKEYGYEVYPITPKYQEIDGDQAFKSIKDLPKAPDIVNFVVNPRIGLEIVKECSELGIKNIWLQPGTISDELLDLCLEKEIHAEQGCVLVALPPK